VSTAHADGLTLAVAGRVPVACDLEIVSSRPWADLLGDDRRTLSIVIARDRGEDADAAATRVWAAGECLVKAGIPASAPMTLGGAHDGWLELACGRHIIGTYVTQVQGTEEPLALAVLTECSP
jgi:enediyne polyketide synthase